MESESSSKPKDAFGLKASISSSVRGFFRAKERGGRGGEVKGMEKVLGITGTSHEKLASRVLLNVRC
jgi:hypothetical protein